MTWRIRNNTVFNLPWHPAQWHQKLIERYGKFGNQFESIT